LDEVKYFNIPTNLKYNPNFKGKNSNPNIWVIFSRKVRENITQMSRFEFVPLIFGPEK